jgi:PAS domain S-box-containing protein
VKPEAASGEISGYTIIAPVYQNGDFSVYRASRDTDHRSVLIKVPASSRPSPSILRRLEHEYDIARGLDPTRVARALGLVRRGGALALVLEGGEVESLVSRLASPLPVAQFLSIALGIAEALVEVHRHDLVHKDIRPENVFVDANGHVWLTGFGIASRLPRERQAPESPEVIAGTLAYMAPEQTGRMNRSVDARSDLYALGVTLYQMLTGVLPFNAADPMEWVHCHIARPPPPPENRSGKIPESLVAMVLKLLAKPPEERYQTAVGLAADLRYCLREWETRGLLEPFALGAHDTPDRLLISEKLYGRENEVGALLASFERIVSSGLPEFVLLSGYSGIGKTSVVNELHKVLVPPRGLFAGGKFDQLKRDIPYATLGEAFQSLVRQILAKSDAEVGLWREALRNAVGAKGQLLVDLIPALELVMGKQPSLPDVPPKDAQNRFQRVFRQFLGVFARPEHPLVVFLDDLQWIDPATLQLLEHVMTQPEVHHLLLIGAYRDNEVGPSHPLMLALDSIRKTGTTRLQEIALAPLVRDDVVRLVAEALYCERERARPLAWLLHEKTGGNPFFAIQFLTSLVEENLLVFDSGSAGWTWDLAHLQARNYTDNVAELMVGKLNRLGDATREATKQLACLGNAAETATLILIQQRPAAAIHAELWEAVREGLIVRREGAYKFVHDRVREAAYSLVPEDRRAGVHLRIGRLLAEGMNGDPFDAQLFDIVGHFNRGAALLVDKDEKERVAKFNLCAGRKAKASTAYASARVYLASGMSLLDEADWIRRYELMFSLCFERAECEFLSSNFEEANNYVAVLLERATSKIDKARAFRLKIEMYTVKMENSQAIGSALECLRLFDIDLTAHPTGVQIEAGHAAVSESLQGRSIEALIDSPLTTDPEIQAAMQTLSLAIRPGLLFDANLCALLVCHLVRLSVKHGVTGASAYGYVCFGLMLAGDFHRYVDGYRFAKLGRDLVEKHGFVTYTPKVYVVSTLAAFWTQPLTYVLDLQRAAFRIAMEAGDLITACHGWLHALTTLHLQGESLDVFWREAETAVEFARQAKFQEIADIIATQQRFIASVLGRPLERYTLGGELFDEAAFEARLNVDRKVMLLWWHGTLKLQECFLFGKYEIAFEASAKIKTLLETMEGTMVGQTARLLDYIFYTALTVAALYDQASAEQQREWRELLTAHFEQLREWDETNGSTFRDKVALVAAETARIDGRNEEAMRLYEEAIKTAHKNGFVQNEAVANELASRFYGKGGFETIARAYLKEARYAYIRWGANGKVRQLEDQHSWLVESPAAHSHGIIATTPERLDLMTVIKASQAISGELVVERLVETLLRIVFENAGAQEGYLFVEPGGEVFAATHLQGGKMQVAARQVEAPSASDAPASIIQYVKRTRETVILPDASTGAGEFSGDPYLRLVRPRSVLCMPILHQTQLAGVLYLENNLATGAFTPERCAVLAMISSQAAISLEIARLYADLQRSQADLQSQTYLLQLILDSIADGVSVANERGEITLRNPAAGNILGLAAAKGPPETWAQHYGFYLPDKTTPFPEADMPLAKAARGEEVNNVEMFMRHPGRPQGAWLNFTGRPLADKTNVIHGGVIVFSDITARKQAEQEIRDLNAELEQRVIDRTRKLEAANKELESFSYSVSHDLRAPLRSIDGFSRILEEDYADKLDDEGQENLRKIRVSTQRMRQLIDDMLQLSRVTLTEIRREPVDLSALASAVFEELRSSEPQRSVEWICEPGLIVEADGALMRIVLENLLGNAWKFTGHQPAPRIEFGRGEHDGVPVYYVRDNGAGFDAQFAHKLFQAFQRLHTAKEFPGTGIGLATVHRVIQRHGGRVCAEGERGRGAAFFFTLPEGLGSN